MSDFEQWAENDDYAMNLSIERDEDGRYCDIHIENMLRGWNAAIASMQGEAVDAGELERLRNSDVLLTDVINWLKERDLYHDADYFGEGLDLAAILSTHESECIGKNNPIAYIRLSDLIDLTQSDHGKLKIKHIFNNPSKEHNARPLFTYPPDSASKIAEQDARIKELEQQLEEARNKLGKTIKTLAWACDSFESSYCGFSAKSKATLQDIGIENTAILNILGKGTIPPDQAIDAAIRQIGGAE